MPLPTQGGGRHRVPLLLAGFSAPDDALVRMSFRGGKQDAAALEGHPVPPLRRDAGRRARLGHALGLVAAVMLLLAPAASAEPPANDNFEDAKELTNPLPIEVPATNVEATKESGESISFFGAGHSVWFEWEATATEWVTIGACGSDFSTVIGVFTGNDVANLTRIVSGNSAEGPHCPYREREYTFRASAGSAYVIGVDGNSFGFPEAPAPSVEGAVALRIESTPPPDNDDFASPADLTSTGKIYDFEPENRFYFARLEGYNWTATKEAGEPDHEGDPGGASVWYEWTAPATGTLRMSACCFAFPVVGIYTGDSVDALTEVPTQSEFPPELTAQVTGGQSYRIAVDGRFDEVSGEPAKVYFAVSAAMILPPLPAPSIGSSDSPPRDLVAPETTISKQVLKRKPPIWSFHFRSTEPGSTFECRLDKRPFAKCGSSKTFKHTKPGRHTLKVRAIDPSGNVDPWPAVAHFAVPSGVKPHR